MYQSLYRKYRPTNFDQVVGQDIIVRTLTNSIKNNQIAHAYIFEGPRGTGKTSIAKIFAKTINCTNLEGNNPCNKCVCCTQILNNNSMDVREIDAASCNSVDNVREIISNCDALPAYGKYKVYIIDEVHMFSNNAFNALLKTLEEPPAHVIFILATTDPQKIPSTIISRCQTFDFKKISEDNIYNRLKYICGEEKIKIEDKALYTISRFANGGLRDAIGMLEQVIAYKTNDIMDDDVHNVNGTLTNIDLKEFVLNIFKKNIFQVFELIDAYDSKGKNLVQIVNEIIIYLTNCLLLQKATEYAKKRNINKLDYEDIVVNYDYQTIYTLLIELNSIYQKIRNNIDAKLVLQLEIIRILGKSDKIQDIQPIKVQEIKEIKQATKKTKLETSKEKKVVESEPIKLKNKYLIKNMDTFNKFKNIRVNNTLFEFDKGEFKSVKDNIVLINSLLLDKTYADLCALIMDGKIKAASNNSLVFVYDDLLDCNNFNLNLIDIEKIFKETFKKDYSLIGLTKDEWEPYKNKFNNKEKFSFIDNSITLKEIFDIEKETNKIESIFNELIKEEK